MTKAIHLRVIHSRKLLCKPNSGPGKMWVSATSSIRLEDVTCKNCIRIYRQG